MSRVVETLVAEAQVGMVRMWNEGRTSTITSIVRTSPRSRRLKITYVSDSPVRKPDGVMRHNTVALSHALDSWLPIVTDPAKPCCAGGPIVHGNVTCLAEHDDAMFFTSRVALVTE